MTIRFHSQTDFDPLAPVIMLLQARRSQGGRDLTPAPLMFQVQTVETPPVASRPVPPLPGKSFGKGKDKNFLISKAFLFLPPALVALQGASPGPPAHSPGPRHPNQGRRLLSGPG